MFKCNIRSVLLYGCNTYEKREREDKLVALKMWIWRRKIKWLHRMRNEEVLNINKENRTLLQAIQKDGNVY